MTTSLAMLAKALSKEEGFLFAVHEGDRITAPIKNAPDATRTLIRSPRVMWRPKALVEFGALLRRCDTPSPLVGS